MFIRSVSVSAGPVTLALQGPGELCEFALVVDHVQILNVESDVAGTPARQRV